MNLSDLCWITPPRATMRLVLHEYYFELLSEPRSRGDRQNQKSDIPFIAG
jgi:hypothetical protein